MRLLAPSKSRNFSRESHRRLRTSSSSIIAMCAAGPPKAVVPSRRKNKASSSIGTCLFSEIDSGDSMAACSAMSCAPSFWEPCVERQRPSTNQKQKDETEQHAHIRAGFMQRSPKSVLRERDDLGRIYGNRNINKKRHRRQPRKKADQHQSATNNLNHSDKRGHDLRRRNADFHEASDSEGVREQKLLYTFGKEDPTHQNTDEQDRFRRAIRPCCISAHCHCSPCETREMKLTGFKRSRTGS